MCHNAHCRVKFMCSDLRFRFFRLSSQSAEFSFSLETEVTSVVMDWEVMLLFGGSRTKYLDYLRPGPGIVLSVVENISEVVTPTAPSRSPSNCMVRLLFSPGYSLTIDTWTKPELQRQSQSSPTIIKRQQDWGGKLSSQSVSHLQGQHCIWVAFTEWDTATAIWSLRLPNDISRSVI